MIPFSDPVLLWRRYASQKSDTLTGVDDNFPKNNGVIVEVILRGIDKRKMSLF
jgi:hypothetical protein